MNYLEYFQYILFKDYYCLCESQVAERTTLPPHQWHYAVFHGEKRRLACLSELLSKLRSGEAGDDFVVLREFHAKHSREVPGIARYTVDFAGMYKKYLRAESIHESIHQRLLGKNTWQ